MKPDFKAIVQGPRKIPLAMEKIVEDQIGELLRRDIIEPVEEYSPIQSPIVLVKKKDSGHRMCIDMRAVNKQVLKDFHPFPTWEQLTAKLNGATIFTKLDLKNAFYHVRLDEKSRYVTTFTTHVGLFRFKRLMFGLSASSEIFQRVMEQLFR